jgi:hypothetical protein
VGEFDVDVLENDAFAIGERNVGCLEHEMDFL